MDRFLQRRTNCAHEMDPGGVEKIVLGSSRLSEAHESRPWRAEHRISACLDFEGSLMVRAAAFRSQLSLTE
jgi:hypothetical protein